MDPNFVSIVIVISTWKFVGTRRGHCHLWWTSFAVSVKVRNDGIFYSHKDYKCYWCSSLFVLKIRITRISLRVQHKYRWLPISLAQRYVRNLVVPSLPFNIQKLQPMSKSKKWSPNHVIDYLPWFYIVHSHCIIWFLSHPSIYTTTDNVRMSIVLILIHFPYKTRKRKYQLLCAEKIVPVADYNVLRWKFQSDFWLKYLLPWR